jgi:hypothetical protein
MAMTNNGKTLEPMCPALLAKLTAAVGRFLGCNAMLTSMQIQRFNSTRFIQPRGSSQRSQQPATGLYTETYESNPLPDNPRKMHFNITLSSKPRHLQTSFHGIQTEPLES